ncbi:unnamed protein product (macronuclear) [Paramecium tetraurelia]|uniref:Transmembrane protein n=1 Tax=Paramecium tetraurelia TaxID=5888 RepID=A0DNG3_PARTE|nr:uncharacterized protein GSPATT00018776001 [Paramecium tetraurelia]CAK84580.1 unnamed protein product [Paramecium tetraurelia]|eukprot:XP_001451977.1 hypothetical protein (macronuclear) [Paramecium tetraurelia strain d4-2]
MNRKLISIFFIILTLGGNQAKEDIPKYKRCLEYNKEKIFGCINNHITSAFTFQSVTTFASFVIAKIAIWLAGFTAMGPAAGSFAAFLQSLIGNVAAGSFFSFLQAVAMGKSILLLIPSLCVGTVVGIIYLVFSCFRNEYCTQEEQVKSQPNPQENQQSNDKSSNGSNNLFEQNNNKQEESFWSQSLNFITNSNSYTKIAESISDLYNQLPNMPQQVIKLKKQVIDYSSPFLKFTSDVLEFSSQVASSIKKQIEEGQDQMGILYNQITSTFNDYVEGINDLFDFVWRNREIIKEAFEYVIVVLQEQFNKIMTIKKFIEDRIQSKKQDACQNNFIEYLANL